MAGGGRELGTEREIGRMKKNNNNKEEEEAGTRSRHSVMGGRVSPSSSWIPLQPPFPGNLFGYCACLVHVLSNFLPPIFRWRKSGLVPVCRWRGAGAENIPSAAATPPRKAVKLWSQTPRATRSRALLSISGRALLLCCWNCAGSQAGGDPRCKGLSRRRQRTRARWSAAGQVNL